MHFHDDDRGILHSILEVGKKLTYIGAGFQVSEHNEK